MLLNAYFVFAKTGDDTAENERSSAGNVPQIGNYLTGPLPVRDSRSPRYSRIACGAMGAVAKLAREGDQKVIWALISRLHNVLDYVFVLTPR